MPPRRRVRPGNSQTSAGIFVADRHNGSLEVIHAIGRLHSGIPTVGGSPVAITPVGRLFEAHLTGADIDASTAFYRDRLGLDLVHIFPARQAAFLCVGPAAPRCWGSGRAADDPRPDAGVVRWHEWNIRQA